MIKLKCEWSESRLVSNLRIALETVKDGELSIIPILRVAQNRAMGKALDAG